MTARYQPYILNFKIPGGTSRGVLRSKETWFIILNSYGKIGIGECGLFRGLSYDDRPDYEKKLAWVCNNIDLGLEPLLDHLKEFPSIQFGLEVAFKSLTAGDTFSLFPSEFTQGKSAISINGLIWMGEKGFMKTQIEEKIKSGFGCIKMKIGAIDFEEEIKLLQYVRKEFTSNDIELRVDANGAFKPSEALEKLKQLSNLKIHSIEQPIKRGQIQEMIELCRETPLPIALDEELIGVNDVTKKKELLQTIQPHYIILKPSLVGGFRGSQEWIDIADQEGIGWWITSALESNIGLNAIAQWTFTLNSTLPQGLGTGSLFTNNFDSSLTVNRGELHYNPELKWNVNL
jgi:o-succinylbenzoate synthase